MGLKDGARTFRAIMWRGAEWTPIFETHRSAVQVAYSIERNHFQGATTIELRLAAVRPPAASGPGAVPVAAGRGRDDA